MGELTVIGASFGRTGTASVRLALEQLGFGPCHHIRHLYASDRHARAWLRVAEGEPADWPSLLSGFTATLTWPASCFWRELAEANPSAKVLTVLRDPGDWYAGLARTHYQARPKKPKTSRDRVMEHLVWNGVFGGRFTDPHHAMDVYRAHLREVRATIPADRLIEVDPARGWPPLCEQLGVPVPDEPFPYVGPAAVPRPGSPLDDKGTLVAKRA